MSTRPILTSGTRASTDSGVTLAATPSRLAIALHRSTSKPTISRVFGSGAANGGTSAKVPQRSSFRCWMSCNWSARADRLALRLRATTARESMKRWVVAISDSWGQGGSVGTQVGQETLRPRVLRAAEKGLGRGRFENAAGVHEPDPVGNLPREGHLVGDA